MIGIFLVALPIFLLAMAGLAVGTLAGRRGLSGGCAGPGQATDDAQPCQTCGRPAAQPGCAAVARNPESLDEEA